MANADWMTGPVLVLGGTGKTGRRVAERLRATGRQVRIGSRAAAPAFDWGDRVTWAPALDGMAAAYVAFQPDLALPGATDAVAAFVERTAAAGVGKLVLLSGRGEPEAEDAEDLVMASGLDWTVLRSSWFAQNFSENFFLDPILAGEVALPRGLAAEPFVDVEDLAEVAVAALSDPAHSRRLYELTGPKALTFAEAIGEIARASGRRIDFLEVPPEAYRAELLRQQVPAEVVDLVMYLFTTVLDGRNTPIADGVRQALGRDPRNFSGYAERTARSWVWGDIDA